MPGIHATNKGGGDFETPEAGSYIANLYKIIDIGTQVEQFQGKPAKPARKVLFYFELLEDEEGKEYRMTNGEPFSVMEKYTLSTSPKANLRKVIDAWRGQALTEAEAEDFDVTKLLGQTARVQVTLDESGDRTWVNLKSVGFTKKSLQNVNPTMSWSVEDPDMKVFESFPDWLLIKINAAAEWSAKGVPAGTRVDPKSGDTIIKDLPDGDPLDLEGIKKF